MDETERKLLRVGRVSAILHLIKKHKITGQNLLDLGCGAGHMTKFIGNHIGASNFYAVEKNLDDVNKAREKGVRVWTGDMDGSTLPYLDSSIDVIYAGEIIEHLVNTETFLNEIYRIIKSEGKVLLSTPNLAWWLNRLVLFFGYQPYHTEVSPLHAKLGKLKAVDESQGHLRIFTLKSLKDILHLTGFKIIDVCGASRFSRVKGGSKIIVNLLDRLLSRKASLAFVIVMLLKKS